MGFLKFMNGIGILIAVGKVIFWSFIVCVILLQTWANYLQLENEMRLTFFVVSSSVIFFLFFGFISFRDRRILSPICTIGTTGIVGGCIAGFWYMDNKDLAVYATLWGSCFFITMYLFVKNMDHLGHYSVSFFCVCLGLVLGICYYLISGLLGPIPIGCLMGFIMAVVYFFEDEDD